MVVEEAPEGVRAVVFVLAEELVELAWGAFGAAAALGDEGDEAGPWAFRRQRGIVAVWVLVILETVTRCRCRRRRRRQRRRVVMFSSLC